MTAKSIKCICIVLACILLLHDRALSQRYHIKFDHIGTDEGLSHGSVFSLLQDSKGFMWIGTREGVNKYDGYKFTTYYKTDDKIYDVSSKTITNLEEDADGNIWMTTQKGNLLMVDVKHDTILEFTDHTFPFSLSSIEIDDDGNIWLGTVGKGLALFDRKTKSFTYYTSEEANPSSISNNYIHTILEDSDHHLWIGTFEGLDLFDKKSRTFTRFKPDEKVNGALTVNGIACLFEDSKKQLWIGGATGLNVLEKVSDKVKRFRNGDPQNMLPKNTVIAIAEDPKGNLWIGTQNGGLSVLDRKSNSFYNYVTETGNTNSISDNSITSLLKDSKGNMWIGTFSHGVDLVGIDKTKFTLYTSNASGLGLSHSSVVSILEDVNNNLWIGTDGGGLNYFDRKYGTFTYYRHQANNPNSICGNHVLKVIEDGKGNLWIATWGSGLTVFNKEKNTFRHYKHDPEDVHSLINDNVITLYQDKEKNIWIGSFSGGLNLYNPQQDNFIRYNTVLNFPNGFNNNKVINYIGEDSRGNLWVGAEGIGLCLLDKTTKAFAPFRSDQGPHSISDIGVVTLFEDSHKRLWIGTRGGLNLMDRERKTFRPFHKSDGLPSEQIFGILEDAHGNLWLSTSNGISRFNPGDNTFKNFGIDDGLQAKEFISNSACESRTGAMYFGGPNGFNEFYPDSITEKKFDPPILFTDFELFNKAVKISDRAEDKSPLTQHISETKSIVLPHSASVLSVGFASLNYTSDERKQYAYIMEGFDTGWNYIGTKHSVTFTNLDPGDYTLKVKGLNNQGEWSSKMATLSITITPPFWMTWWFRTAAALLLIGMAIGYYWLRTRTIKRQNKKLERLVLEKTQQLQSANEELVVREEEITAQNEELSLRNDELVSRQEEIASQRDLLANQNQRLQEAGKTIAEHNQTLDREVKERTKELVEYNQQLEQFAFIAAHNLRAPVARILGLGQILELSKDNPDEEKMIVDKLILTTEELDQVVKDITTILAIRKNNTLSLTEINLTEEVRLIKDLLANEIADTQAEIKQDFSQANLIHSVKPYLDSILLNLLSNAIKYRQPNRTPCIQLRSEIQDGYVCLLIKDNGLGIDLEHHQQQLFNLYKRFHDHVEGKGMGLYLVKTQVMALGGKIEVESAVNVGTTFKIFLKKNKVGFSKK